ncbi:hypothetical protein ACU686_07665 [Yinghuangia aomiensis]
MVTLAEQALVDLAEASAAQCRTPRSGGVRECAPESGDLMASCFALGATSPPTAGGGGRPLLASAPCCSRTRPGHPAARPGPRTEPTTAPGRRRPSLYVRRDEGVRWRWAVRYSG